MIFFSASLGFWIFICLREEEEEEGEEGEEGL